MTQHAPFLKNLETEQVYEWTEKLAKIAYQRGLVPFDPEGNFKTNIASMSVSKMIKTELEVEARRFGVKLNRRKSVATLREEVQALRDNE